VLCAADNAQVQRHLALSHGVVALSLTFSESAEETFDAAIRLLVHLGYLSKGRLVAIVQSGRKPIWRSANTHIIQVGLPAGLSLVATGSVVQQGGAGIAGHVIAAS
jgi:pyruvate kinase